MSYLVALNDRAWPAVTVLLAVVVTVLSLVSLPGQMTGSSYFHDKLNHLVGYAVISFPVALARPRGWLVFLALIGAWGAVIELIQPHFGRHASLLDAAANGAGIVLGAAAALILRRLLRLPPRGEALRESRARRR